MAEDAKHQAALILVQYYWDWLTASAEARVDAQAVANLEATQKAINRRVKLRDAALLKVDQTETALGLARMVAQDSAGRADVARARIQAQFPDLPLPVQAPDVVAEAQRPRKPQHRQRVHRGQRYILSPDGTPNLERNRFEG